MINILQRLATLLLVSGLIAAMIQFGIEINKQERCDDRSNYQIGLSDYKEA
jgi:hypothetical protein